MKRTKITLLLLGFLFAQEAIVDQHGIYIVCEKMPEIAGGLKTIASMLEYPPKAKKERWTTYAGWPRKAPWCDPDFRGLHRMSGGRTL